jgi:hypothetical protein
MWDQIKQINTHLPQVAHVSYYLETLFNLERNLELLAAQNIDHHILKDIQIFQGAGAYEVAINEGFAGTVEDWLASLIGPQGDPGVIDEPALSTILSDIANNAAGIAALVPVVVDHTAQFSNYVLESVYDTHVNTVTTTLATHAAAIAALGAVPPFELPVLEVETLALGVFNSQINSSLSGFSAGLIDVEDLLAALQINVDDNLSSFNTFVLSNATDIARITVLESSSGGHASSIVALESVTNDMAAVQLTLTAESATHFSNYDSLVIVTDNAASQINALQVTNNANAASITSIELAYVTEDEALAASILAISTSFDAREATLTADILAEQTARVSADSAAATDRTAIRAEFSAADSGVLSSATALVTAERTARTTADSAAATDRTAIRAEFNAADSAVLSSATALVTAETSARTTAFSAAASDRTAIRAEFNAADSGVLSSATALVAGESSARSSADSAVAGLVTTLRADFDREIRQILPWHFNSEGYFWTTAFGGLPSAVAAPTDFTYVDVSGIGKVAQVSVFPKYLTPRGVIKPYIGMKLRLETKVRATVNPTTGAISVSLGSVNGLSSVWAHGDPSFTPSNVTGYNESDTSLVVADGWVTIARYVTCTAISTYDANWRPRLNLTHTGTGGTVQVAYFNIENVTHAEGFTSALVASESSARATAIGAVATNVTTLTSSVGTLSSTVSTQASTLADIEGNLLGKYSISVDGGGNGAFVSLEDSTTFGSVIEISATKIKFNGDVLINGSLQTTKVADNAITQNGSAAANTVASVGASFTARGGTVLIWANFYNTGTTTRTWFIKRNGTTVKTLTANSLPATHLMAIDSPSLGNVTYTAECSVTCNLIDIQYLEILK